MEAIDLMFWDNTPESKLFQVCSIGGDSKKDELISLLEQDVDIDCISAEGETALHYACAKGFLHLINALLRKGANLHVKNGEGKVPLHLAVEGGNKPLIEGLLKYGAEIESKDNAGQTPLLCAASLPKAELLEFLIGKGANDDDCRTGLHIASELGLLENVRFFLKNSPAIIDEKVPTSGSTALHLAILNSHIEVARQLVTAGASIKTTDAEGRNSLHILCEGAKASLIPFLTLLFTTVGPNEKPDFVNSSDKRGRGALHRACKRSIDYVKLLVENGAAVDSVDKDGNSPFMIACSRGTLQIMILLLSKKIDIHRQNGKGWSSLHMATMAHQNSAVKILVDRGARVDAVNNERKTALHYACASGNVSAVKALLDSSKDIINMLDKNGETALIQAIEGEYVGLVKLLVRRGAKIDEVLMDGETILHKVCRKGNPTVVRFLIEQGANQDKQDLNLQRTALHFACFYGKLEVVKTLLDRFNSSEDIAQALNVLDRDGKTALQLACRQGYGSVVRLLLSSHMTEMMSTQGAAALREACNKGSVEIISDLLEANVPFDREALQIASENRHVEAVKYLLLHGHNNSHATAMSMKANLTTFPNNQNKNTITMMSALRIAVEGNHTKAVELLLNQATSGSSAIDERDSDGLTLLHFAAMEGYNEVVAILIPKFGRLDQTDRHGRTALHVAASNGHESVALLLLKNNAPIDHKDRDGSTALYHAYLAGHTGIAKLLLRKGATVACAPHEHGQRLLQWATSLEEAVLVELLLKADASVDENEGGAAPLQLALSKKSLPITKALIIAGTKPHELERSLTETFPSFWENLSEAEIAEGFLNNPSSPKMQQRFLKLMNHSRSAIKVFNVMMKPGQQRHTTRLADFFEHVLKFQPMKVLSTIFRLTSSLRLAASEKVAESKDLLTGANMVEAMVTEIFASDCMDDPYQAISILLTKRIKNNSRVIRMHYVEAFADGGLIAQCIASNEKGIFGLSAVNNVIGEVFCTCWMTGATTNNDILDTLNYPRATPIWLFTLYVLARCLLLILIANVVVDEYSEQPRATYNVNAAPSWSRLELLMAVCVLADLCHEIGEIVDGWQDYIKDEWNVLDFITVSLGLLWFIIRLFSQQFATARLLLSVSAIPFALGILRFLTINKTLGELVISIRVMGNDLLAFVVIYMLTISGFGIALRGMFYGTPSFMTDSSIYLELFSFSLNNFDFSSFVSDSKVVSSVGIILCVVYVVLTSVVLFNLLVARMTNSYQMIYAHALKEWSFTKAKMVLGLLHFKERNVYHMLPAPLNLVPIFYTFFGLYTTYESHDNCRISRGGTASNVLLVLLFLPLKLFLRAILAIYHRVMQVRLLSSDELQQRQAAQEESRKNKNFFVTRMTRQNSVLHHMKKADDRTTSRYSRNNTGSRNATGNTSANKVTPLQPTLLLSPSGSNDPRDSPITITNDEAKQREPGVSIDSMVSPVIKHKAVVVINGKSTIVLATTNNNDSINNNKYDVDSDEIGDYDDGLLGNEAYALFTREDIDRIITPITLTSAAPVRLATDSKADILDPIRSLALQLTEQDRSWQEEQQRNNKATESRFETIEERNKKQNKAMERRMDSLQALLEQAVRDIHHLRDVVHATSNQHNGRSFIKGGAGTGGSTGGGGGNNNGGGQQPQQRNNSKQRG